MNHDKITVTFPDLFASLPGRKSRLADPFRILLLKLVEHNPTLKIITPQTGRDRAMEHYAQVIDMLKIYDSKRVCFIFVEDTPVLLDYSENSNWKHGPIAVFAQMPNICKAVIKLNCDSSSIHRSPIPVFPFIFPGPNDYRDFLEFYEEDTFDENFDIFSRMTYKPEYNDRFLECYHNDSFKHSIAAIWGVPLFKAYRSRKFYSESAKQIPGACVIEHELQKSVSMDEYYQILCEAKFGIAIRGSAKWSHREMELSSIGIPWFGENRNQLCYKPFVPGKHYIEITRKTFLDVFRYYDEHYEEALEIGLNAREYFNKWHRQTGLQLIFREICQKIQDLA